MNIKSLKEEKHIVASIEKVKNKKKKIVIFADKKFDFVDYKPQLDELKVKKQPLLDELAKYNAIINENQKLQDENYEKINQLKKNLDGITKQRETLKTEYDEKKKLLDVKWAEWKKEQAEIKKQKDIEY